MTKEAPLGWNTSSNARIEVKMRDYKDTLAAQIGSEIEARAIRAIQGGNDESLYDIGRALLETPHLKSLIEFAVTRVDGA